MPRKYSGRTRRPKQAHEPAQPQCACYATATSACPWPLYTLAPAPALVPAGFLRRAERGRLRPQAKEEVICYAAKRGDLATLKRLVEEGVNLEAKGRVSAAPPAAPPAPSAPRPPLSPPAAPAAPRLAATAHRVWCRRRASAVQGVHHALWRDGPHIGG